MGSRLYIHITAAALQTVFPGIFPHVYPHWHYLTSEGSCCLPGITPQLSSTHTCSSTLVSPLSAEYSKIQETMPSLAFIPARQVWMRGSFYWKWSQPLPHCFWPQNWLLIYNARREYWFTWKSALFYWAELEGRRELQRGWNMQVWLNYFRIWKGSEHTPQIHQLEYYLLTS